MSGRCLAIWRLIQKWIIEERRSLMGSEMPGVEDMAAKCRMFAAVLGWDV